MAKLTKTLSPAGTLTPAASVTASVVPSVFDEAVPTFSTKAIAASAGDRAGPISSTSRARVPALTNQVFRVGTSLTTASLLSRGAGPGRTSGPRASITFDYRPLSSGA